MPRRAAALRQTAATACPDDPDGRRRGAPAPLTATETEVLAALRWRGFPATETWLDEHLSTLDQHARLEVLHDLLERGLVCIYWGLTRDGVAATPDPLPADPRYSAQQAAATEDRTAS